MKSLKPFLTAILLLLAAMPARGVAQGEADLLAVLKNPEANFLEKQNACRDLVLAGTAEAVPVLAGLLGDEKLSHMARMALEPIPDPSVDAALRDALAKVTGRPLLGVIASIGVRHDETALPALAVLLSNQDDAVADAAARALGTIGSAQAAQALQSALGGKEVSPARTKSFCEGLFRCAESLNKGGKTAESQAIYDAIAALDKTPHQIRTAALRGAVLTRAGAGLPLVLDALRDGDYAMFLSAIRIAMEREGADTTEALASALAGLPAERQIVVIKALGQRGDPASGPALLKLVDNAAPPVQIELVKTLTRLVHAPVVPVLVKLSLATDDELSAAARESLAGFPDQSAADAIANLLGSADAGARLLGAELIGQRDIGLALPALMKAAATDTDEAVRVSALKTLRDRAGMEEFDALIAILLGSPSDAVTQAAAHALVAVGARQPGTGNIEIEKAIYGDRENRKTKDVTEKVAALVKEGTSSIDATNSNFGDPARGTPKQLTVHYKVDGVSGRQTAAEGETLKISSANAPAALVDPLVAAFGKAAGPTKVALLRVLRTTGGTKALGVVRSATADGDPDVRKNAQRILCEWPSPDALPAIRDLALNQEGNLRGLALRAWLRLLPLQDASDEERLAQVKEALPLATGKQEKWAALGALREIPLPAALAMVVPLLEDPELAEEACIGAVEISKKIASQDPAAVHAAMTRVASLTKDKDLAAQAAKIAKKTAGK